MTDINDEKTRLGQFMWDEIEGNHFPVFIRNDDDRFVSKFLMEVLLFSDPTCRLLSFTQCVRDFRPLQSYTMTVAEFGLLCHICSQHLMSVLNDRGLFSIRHYLASDRFLSYEEFLPFYESVRRLKSNTLSNFHTSHALPRQIVFQIPHSQGSSGSVCNNGMNSTWCSGLVPQETNKLNIPPLIHTISQAQIPGLRYGFAVSKHMTDYSPNGWVQLNNVIVPYVTKTGSKTPLLVQHETNRCMLPSNAARYVPIQVLTNCGIVAGDMFQPFVTKQERQPIESNAFNLSIKALSVRATSEDIIALNTLISRANIHTDTFDSACGLVNLYHLLICSPILLYAKFLGSKDPKENIMKQFKETMQRITTTSTGYVGEYVIGRVKFRNFDLVAPFVTRRDMSGGIVPLNACPMHCARMPMNPQHVRLAKPIEADLMNIAYVYCNMECTVQCRSNAITYGIYETMVSLNYLYSLGVVDTHIPLDIFRRQERQKLLNSLNVYSTRFGTINSEMSFAEYLLFGNCGCSEIYNNGLHGAARCNTMDTFGISCPVNAAHFFAPTSGMSSFLGVRMNHLPPFINIAKNSPVCGSSSRQSFSSRNATITPRCVLHHVRPAMAASGTSLSSSQYHIHGPAFESERSTTCEYANDIQTARAMPPTPYKRQQNQMVHVGFGQHEHATSATSATSGRTNQMVPVSSKQRCEMTNAVRMQTCSSLNASISKRVQAANVSSTNTPSKKNRFIDKAIEQKVHVGVVDSEPQNHVANVVLEQQKEIANEVIGQPGASYGELQGTDTFSNQQKHIIEAVSLQQCKVADAFSELQEQTSMTPSSSRSTNRRASRNMLVEPFCSLHQLERTDCLGNSNIYCCPNNHSSRSRSARGRSTRFERSSDTAASTLNKECSTLVRESVGKCAPVGNDLVSKKMNENHLLPEVAVVSDNQQHPHTVGSTSTDNRIPRRSILKTFHSHLNQSKRCKRRNPRKLSISFKEAVTISEFNADPSVEFDNEANNELETYGERTKKRLSQTNSGTIVTCAQVKSFCKQMRKREEVINSVETEQKNKSNARKLNDLITSDLSVTFPEVDILAPTRKKNKDGYNAI